MGGLRGLQLCVRILVGADVYWECSSPEMCPRLCVAQLRFVSCVAYQREIVYSTLSPGFIYTLENASTGDAKAKLLRVCCSMKQTQTLGSSPKIDESSLGMVVLAYAHDL